MRTETQSEYERRIESVIRLVLDRISDPPDAEELAAIGAFSPRHFSRIFAGAVGESPSAFVRRLRLERSAWQLRAGETPVTEIAFDAGYESLEGFSRTFRAAFGASPSDFRRLGVGCELPCRCGVHWRADDRPLRTHLHKETKMKIKVKTLAPLRLLALRHIGPYHQIGGTFDRLFALAGPLGVPMQGVLATYLDDPDATKPEELRSDACLVVPADYELPEEAPAELRLDAIAGGDYAVATHMGAYDGLGDAWGRFYGQIVPATGREPGNGACFEWYVNDCNEVPVEEVRTDLYVALKPATVPV